MNKTFVAISILLGTIIGAGVLGIPYVFMRSGFSLGMLNLLIVGFIVALCQLYLGEITLRTKDFKHLSGYASKYLGKKGKYLMFLALVIGIYGAILAYLVGVSESLSFMIYSDLTHSLYLGIAFWLFMSILSYQTLKALEKGETLGIALIGVLIVSISVMFWNKIDISNLQYATLPNLFIPFGVVLFAFMGFSTVPEVARVLKNDKHSFKKSIIWTNIIVFIIYAIFAAIVLGVQGAKTPEIATLALGKPFILLGILTMFTSYLALSVAFMDNLRFDFYLKKSKAWFITIAIPLILFIIVELTNSSSFTKILGIGGVLSGGLTAILILFMIKSAKKSGDRKPEYSIPYSSILTGVLILIFTAGAVLEILNTI